MSTTSARQKRTSQRQREILDASLQCFLEHGIEAATIEQIRDASGASSGSIYHHFGSKQSIAVALYAEGMEELNRRFREMMSGQTKLRSGIRALLGAYFDWFTQQPDQALYMLRVATADLSTEQGFSINELNRVARTELANFLQPYRESGEVIDIPEELYASLVYGPSIHLARHWLAGRFEFELESTVQVFSEAAYASLTSFSKGLRRNRK